LIPGKVIEKLILENISRHVKDKKIIRISQQGFPQEEVMPDQFDKFL